MPRFSEKNRKYKCCSAETQYGLSSGGMRLCTSVRKNRSHFESESDQNHLYKRVKGFPSPDLISRPSASSRSQDW